MRSTLFLFILFLISTFSFAQVSIGIKGGYVFSDLRFTGAGGVQSVGSNTTHSGGLTSWHADAIVNIPLGQTNFYLQPTVGYVKKGASFSNGSGSGQGGVYIAQGQRLSLDYIEMPVNVVYKVSLPFGKLVFGGGPYIAYGIEGRYKYVLSQNGTPVANNTKRVHFTNDYGSSSATINMRPWDAGLNALVSLEFKSNIIVGANYSLGGWNVNRVDNGEIKNQYVGVSVGFLFNREDW